MEQSSAALKQAEADVAAARAAVMQAGVATQRAEREYERIISLPMFPSMTDADSDDVLRAAKNSFLLRGNVPPAPAGPKVLRIARSTYPDVIDPQKSSFGIEIEVMKFCYEGILAIDAKGNIGPGSADKWTIAPDGKSIVFHIRDGLKRADGSALNASDFEYALKRAVDRRHRPSGQNSRQFLCCFLPPHGGAMFERGAQVGVRFVRLHAHPFFDKFYFFSNR